MNARVNRRVFARGGAALVAAGLAMWPALAGAQSKEPIKIGFGMALTGPLAPNGKSSLVAMKIWEEDVNAKGGLLGRPVKLVYYDDQSAPANVPAIYTKLLDIDKVDLVVSGYATNMIAPAMPVVMQKNKLFVSLFGTGVNDQFKYPRYFSMIPTGPTPKPAFTEGFFRVAMAQNPKPQTIAIVAVDAEFGRATSDGGRENAHKYGLKVVYDKTYPPTTTDFTPIVRAVQATNPDLVLVCSYPLDSVGMVKAINEVGFKPKMIGGAMVGLQATVFKTQLGPLLNGLVNYDTWLPVEKMQFPGSMDLVKKYQARAAAEGVDPLGYYMPVWAYAYLQVLGQAIEATKSLDDDKLADHIRKTTFKTVVGDVAFGPAGEWVAARMLQVQFQNIKNNDLAQFRDLSTQVVVDPPQYVSGKVVYPYADAKK
ncbi:MAG TPA: amino acid ABC transporter substrate-binding protein [Xanthobacteraceae bacterium]|jgi:branched-chain amino acid transport system substrate-binding protein|nr:amino acid ABC transporter substrate-binding protein [Xanthobacteraceae bacterium]